MPASPPHPLPIMYLSRFNWLKAVYFEAIRPASFVVVAALLAGLAAALAWLSTRHGVNLSPDSVYYLNVADNVCQGRGLVHTTGLSPDQVGAAVPLTVWPPAYPLLLCGLSWLTGSTVAAARGLSILAFAGLAASCLALGRDCLNLKGGVLASLGMVLFTPMLRVISFAWSEPLFMFCCVTGWWGMWRAWTTPLKRSRYLLLAAAMWGLAGLTRYLGVVLLALGVVMIAAMPLPRRTRWLYATFYGLLTLLPVAGWLLRNYTLTGHFSGDARLGAMISLSQNVWLAAYILLRDFFSPLPLPYPLVLFAFCLGLPALISLGLVTVAWWSLVGRRRISAWFAARSWFDLPWWGWLLLYCLAYITVLVYLASTLQFDPLESRLLSPIYPFVWLLLTAGVTYLYRYLHILEPAWRRRGTGLVWSLLLLLPLVNQLRGQYDNLTQPPAWAYNTPIWTQDPAIVSLPLFAPDAGAIYTNMPAAVSFITRQPAYRLPEEANMAQQAAFFQRDVKAHPGFVIWYVDGWEQKASITAGTLSHWCARLSGSCRLLAVYAHAIVYQFGR